MGARTARAIVTMIRTADWPRLLLHSISPGLMALEVGWTGYAVTIAGMILARRPIDTIVLRRPVGRR